MKPVQQRTEKDGILSFSEEDARQIYRNLSALTTLFGAALGYPEDVKKQQESRNKRARKRRQA